MNTSEHTGVAQPASESATTKAGGCCGGGGCGQGGGGGGDGAKLRAGPATGQEQAQAGGCCGGGACGEGSVGEHHHADAQVQAIYVFSRKQIRELDRRVVEDYSMPTLLLMENAARGVAGIILEGLQGVEAAHVLIVCGPGNNGGDGLALARHLHNHDLRVTVLLAAPMGKYAGDARVNLTIAQRMGLRVVEGAERPAGRFAELVSEREPPHVVVDALFGTGLDRAPVGAMSELIGEMNGHKRGGAPLIAIDVPSGLDADSGRPMDEEGRAIVADLTIALAGVKAGFMAPGAREYVGELAVIDIGAPKELVAELGHRLHGGGGSGGCCGG